MKAAVIALALLLALFFMAGCSETRTLIYCIAVDSNQHLKCN